VYARALRPSQNRKEDNPIKAGVPIYVVFMS